MRVSPIAMERYVADHISVEVPRLVRSKVMAALFSCPVRSISIVRITRANSKAGDPMTANLRSPSITGDEFAGISRTIFTMANPHERDCTICSSHTMSLGIEPRSSISRILSVPKPKSSPRNNASRRRMGARIALPPSITPLVRRLCCIKLELGQCGGK